MLNALKDGSIDFYPGFNFTLERSEYAYYIENGLPGGDVGFSRLDLPEVTHLSQLSGKFLLLPLGAPNMIVLNTKGVYYEEGMHTHEHFV